MHLTGQQSRSHIQRDNIMKIMMLSVAVGFTVAMAGCASKPQINNSSRYSMAPNYYTVRSGDTLSGIAMRYGLDYLSIAEMNDIAPPYRIYVNQSLRLKKSSSPKPCRHKSWRNKSRLSAKQLHYRQPQLRQQQRLLHRRQEQLHQQTILA